MSTLVLAETAQAQHWSFQAYGADLGLTNPTILALHQDRAGYLWVSTEGGLFRYDGDRFQSFQTKSGVKTGHTYSIHSSADGRLWTGSSGGLFRFDGNRFVAVPGFEGDRLEFGALIASDAANLYVATLRGLRSISLSGPGPPRVISPRPASSVFVAPDHVVWFGCGVTICSLHDGRETDWASDRGVREGPWNSIVEDTGGRLWIRSNDAVLVKDPGEEMFHAVRSLSRLDSSRGMVLIATRNGQVLIPNYSGLTICEAENCRNYGVESGLERTEVLAAMEDREGSLWLGYGGHGLARWLGRTEWRGFTEAEGLTNLGVWRIVRDAAGDLWVGTSRGLFQGTETEGRWRFRRSPAVGELTVYGLATETDGSLWIGTFQSGAKGLIRYYPSTGITRLYSPEHPIPRFAINEIQRDPGGTLWIGWGGGVMRVVPGGRQLEPVALPIDGATVSAVQSTPQGLYVSSKKGLYIQQGAVHRLLTVADGLKDDFVLSLAIAPDGALWLAYQSPAGISRLEVKGDRIELRHFTTDEGLPSNVIYSQFFDAQGRHWVGTDSGVAVFEGDRWVRYDVSDGLVWNDTNSHAYLTEADGTVWFGTSGGLSRFHPTVHAPVLASKALITSILRNDLPAQNTDFDSSTHSLAMRFTMLSYRRQAVRFRYRLGTGSSPWVYSQVREVRFAELSPGSYRFEVQGEPVSGTWSIPAVLDFRIRPPWYRSTFALLGWSILFAGAVWLGLRFFRQRALQEELEAAVEARTRDLAAATAHAERTSRFKGEFLANMSHEMRTPLNGVIGVTQLALDASDQPEVVQHLKIVQLSAKGLLSLINDILDFSKIESGLLAVVRSPVRIGPLVSEICLIMQQEALLKGIVLHSAVDHSVPEWLSADETRLRQVLINLVANAIKFTAEGSVAVKVNFAGAQLGFEVVDTGIGIATDKREVIFDAFRQADNSTSRRYGGSGLGLTISKKLVEMMGGQMRLESEPGRGSTFSFTIAAEACAPVESSIEAGSRQLETVESMKILVAEDHKVNQYLIRNLLSKLGHRPTLVENGKEAIDALKRETFDMVLMDIQMPEMDGLEATRLIRLAEKESGGHLPVVALTARVMAGDRDLILDAGMDEHLEKPIQVEKLSAVLAHISSRLELSRGSIH